MSPIFYRSGNASLSIAGFWFSDVNNAGAYRSTLALLFVAKEGVDMNLFRTRMKAVLAIGVSIMFFSATLPVAAEHANDIQYASYIDPSERLDVSDAVAKINAIRRGKGLGSVRIDPALMKAALVHARDLARIDGVSHYGTDGSSPVDRVSRAGYSGVMTGENVSAGQRDLDEVLDGWLNSRSHRKTLLMKEARHMGLALAYDPNTKFRTFWTLVLAEPF